MDPHLELFLRITAAAHVMSALVAMLITARCGCTRLSPIRSRATALAGVLALMIGFLALAALIWEIRREQAPRP